MNNEQNQNDRFYKPAEEITLCGKTTDEEIIQKHYASQEAKPAPKKVQEYMEYSPELQNMLDAKNKGMKFTVGNKYPILERKCINGRLDQEKFKTIDDKGTEQWTEDKYFIACSEEAKLLWNDWPIHGNCRVADLPLHFDVGRQVFQTFVSNEHFDRQDDTTCNLTYSTMENSCSYADEHYKDFERKQILDSNRDRGNASDMLDSVEYSKENSIDIRQVAQEKNVCPFVDEKEFSKVLSGVCEEEQPTWEIDDSEPMNELRSLSGVGKKEDFWGYTDIQGLVKDTGTPLVEDLNKCMAAISKVFGKGDIADPDDIVDHIKKHTNALVTWKEGYLAIEGVKTKITYEEAQCAYKSLTIISNNKIARKIVGKLLADKVNKLFK